MSFPEFIENKSEIEIQFQKYVCDVSETLRILESYNIKINIKCQKKLPLL